MIGVSVGQVLKALGLVLAAISAIGTIIVAISLFGIESDPFLSDDEEALLTAAKWEPVLIGVGSTTIGLVLFGVGEAIDSIRALRPRPEPAAAPAPESNESPETPWA